MNKEMTKEELVEKVGENAKDALYFLEKIYYDFDQMNGHLFDLTEMLDKESFAWFHNFWMAFPTYNELDDLKNFLKDLKNNLINEE